MDACQVGCIGPRKCVKECPQEVITVVDNVAHIDPEKCINCGAAARERLLYNKSGTPHRDV